MEPYAQGSSIGQKGLFGGIADIQDFHHRSPLNLNRLSKTEAFYNRQNYSIII